MVVGEEQTITFDQPFTLTGRGGEITPFTRELEGPARYEVECSFDYTVNFKNVPRSEGLTEILAAFSLECPMPYHPADTNFQAESEVLQPDGPSIDIEEIRQTTPTLGAAKAAKHFVLKGLYVITGTVVEGQPTIDTMRFIGTLDLLNAPDGVVSIVLTNGQLRLRRLQ